MFYDNFRLSGRSKTNFILNKDCDAITHIIFNNNTNGNISTNNTLSNLREINCFNNNSLTELWLGNSEHLDFLCCGDNPNLRILDISKSENLVYLKYLDNSENGKIKVWNVDDFNRKIQTGQFSFHGSYNVVSEKE